VTAVVADASAIVELLLGTPRGETLHRVLEDPTVDVHVPALCDVEVAAVLRRGLLRRRLGADRTYDALEDYLALPLTRHGHTYLLGRIVGLRRNFSAYDAAYVALAEWLGASLVTADERLARGARRHVGIDVAG